MNLWECCKNKPPYLTTTPFLHMEKEHHQLLRREVNYKLPPASHNLVNTKYRVSQLMKYEKWNNQAL
jgi:hypothetical protein